jgi:hypothetical protein
MMGRRPLLARALVALTLLAGAPVLPFGTRSAHACAGCRNPSMPITRLQAVELERGQVRAAAVLAGTGLHVVHQAGCADVSACDEVPAQPLYLHDQRIFPGELRAVGEVGITDHLGVELQLPFRITRTTIRYAAADGGAYEPVDAGNHHRNETLAGIGDPWLLARWNTDIGSFLLALRAGVSVPLGRTQPNPFALGDAGMRHQHIQFGTGTFDPVLGLDVSRAAGTIQLAAYAQAQLALYENRHGFRAGMRLHGGVQAARRIWEALGAGLSLDVVHEAAERWDGLVRQDGNLGRTELLAGLSLTRKLGSTGSTFAGVTARFPVWRRIITGDEPQGSLSSPVMLSLTLSHTFGKN